VDKDRQPLTVDAEKLKVERMLATRAARHTMGPKQKKAVKGQVAAPGAAAPAKTGA
jgi:hypothetical protein